MCGITGAVWSTPQRSISPATLAEMTDAIRHRGPDEAGSHLETMHRDAGGDVPGVALGFRRLSIIDLATAHQPLSNESGKIWLVFNGEIYNFRDLRRRLEGSGHRFKTAGDGETILHLYEDLGTDCFAHLNGMFAIAIWDAEKHRLVLARDRLGQKPLFYAHQAGRLSFASELKALACLSDLPRDVDPVAIDEFLTYQYVPHPATIYRQVRKLPPGHFAVYQGDHPPRIENYWDIQYDVEAPQMSRGEAVTELRRLLADSVRLRLQADVPLGTFLSGGVDSSLITALAQSFREEPIRTFSIGFSVADFDETHYAAMVAQHLGTAHRRFEVNPDAVAIIDRLAWHFDEPFGDSSAVPTWYLCELTRQEVKVALSGDGGDELFAGYDRYRALWLSRQLDRFLPRQWLGNPGWLDRWPDSHRQRSLVRRGKRFLEAFGQPPPRRFMNWLQIFPERLRAELYTDGMLEKLAAEGSDPFEFFHAAWRKVGQRDVVAKASLADLQTYLPGDLMTKVDIASMAHGLEVRQPMLDYRVVEFAARLPTRLKFRGRRGKLLLEDAFRDRLPKPIWRRRKMGFGVPIADWFRGPLKEMTTELLLSPDAKLSQYLDPQGVSRLLEDHVSGRVNHCYRLWNLLVLEKWLRRWT
ncbi:asparagine synthase (glutamine-hydrolyzing) [Planctomycetaceae bacterium SH139]